MVTFRNCILSAIALTWLRICPAVFAEPSGVVIIEPTVAIEPSDVKCRIDSDCTLITTKCNRCECGAAVNVRYEEKYRRLFKETCDKYRGGSCRMRCENPKATCTRGSCLVIMSPREGEK